MSNFKKNIGASVWVCYGVSVNGCITYGSLDPMQFEDEDQAFEYIEDAEEELPEFVFKVETLRGMIVVEVTDQDGELVGLVY